MMSLDFKVNDWLSSDDGSAIERATLASVTITIGDENTVLTEVEDSHSRSVRSHVNLPAYALAEWLLLNWWRLRWEPRRENSTRNWRRAHGIAAIGGGYAWPNIEFSSDGETVSVRALAEARRDVSAIRYLNSVNAEVTARAFEAAVDRLVEAVIARLSALAMDDGGLTALRDEVLTERHDRSLAMDCKRQALAGIDPGDASVDWMREVSSLGTRVGPNACEEILAVLPEISTGLAGANAAVREIQDSTLVADLSWLNDIHHRDFGRGFPWERGARAAQIVRASQQISPGPLNTQELETLVGFRFPLSLASTSEVRSLSGGFRSRQGLQRTSVAFSGKRKESQRFSLARIIGAAFAATEDERVFPVTAALTARQKFERSFGQEFLCPWTSLDEFTTDHGLDDEGIVLAAEHFEVSELLVRSTLVNRGKLSRDRLAPQQ